MKHMLEKLIAKQVKKSRRTTFVVEIRNWISFLFMELVLEASAYTAIKLQYILPENVDLGKITRDTQESYYPLSEMKIRATLKMAEPLHAKIINAGAYIGEHW